MLKEDVASVTGATAYGVASGMKNPGVKAPFLLTLAACRMALPTEKHRSIKIHF